jgi:hypothetical protein
MENCPFIDDFPIKTSIYKGFSMAMLNNQMVNGRNMLKFLGRIKVLKDEGVWVKVSKGAGQNNPDKQKKLVSQPPFASFRLWTWHHYL